MEQELLKQISITQIKRGKRADLIKMAEERNIELNQSETVKEMREVIISEVFGEQENREELEGDYVDPTSEIDVSDRSEEQRLAFEKLEREREKEHLDRERDKEKEHLDREKEREKDKLNREREREKEKLERERKRKRGIR